MDLSVQIWRENVQERFSAYKWDSGMKLASGGFEEKDWGMPIS